VWHEQAGSCKMGDGNGPAVMVIPVNVKNLLALDTQYAISTISTRLRQEDMWAIFYPDRTHSVKPGNLSALRYHCFPGSQSRTCA